MQFLHQMFNVTALLLHDTLLKMRCYSSPNVFNCCFEVIYISQGSAATHLRWSGIFSDSTITNFLLVL